MELGARRGSERGLLNVYSKYERSANCAFYALDGEENERHRSKSVKPSVGVDREQNTNTWYRGAGASRNGVLGLGGRYPAAGTAGDGAAGGL
jgi:hypothetical protein